MSSYVIISIESRRGSTKLLHNLQSRAKDWRHWIDYVSLFRVCRLIDLGRLYNEYEMFISDLCASAGYLVWKTVGHANV